MDNLTEEEQSSIPVEEIPVVEEPLVEEEVVASVEDEPVIESVKPSQNNIQEYEYTAPTEWDPTGEIYNLPGDFDINVKSALEKSPNINLGDNPDSRTWAEIISSALNNTPYKGMFVKALEDTNAEFHQGIAHQGSFLAPAAPKHKLVENQSLKGESAAIRLMGHLGLGSLFQIPLWHTGIWVTFKPPTESEIVELNRLLMSDKIQFGRYSYGYAYSNVVGYTVDRLVDFALSHIYDTTVKTDEISFNQLKDYISSQDIFSLLWGFICTVYPRGFQYQRACTTDPSKCQNIVQEKLNLTKLLWVNSNALTDWQKAHMSNRQSRQKDKASIVKYKEELKGLNKKRVLVTPPGDNEVCVTFRSPSITEYIESAQKWIGEIVQTVEAVVGNDDNLNVEEKESLILTHGLASGMRQYTHWVDSIEFATNIVEDKETIESNLNVLSSDDKIRDKFMDEAATYINESTVAVVGIPAYNCPSCHENQQTKQYPSFVNIIPIDVMQVFFDLITQRLERIRMR